MNRTEEIGKVAAALVSFNGSVSKISKDAKNPFHKSNYATLDNIVQEIRPIMQENKLVVLQTPQTDESGVITVKTMIMHESGQYIESEGTTVKMVKNDPQGAGAAISYARRYDLCAFLSLNTGEDDDGNRSSGKNSKKDDPAPPKLLTKEQTNKIINGINEVAEIGKGDIHAIYSYLKINNVSDLTKDEAEKIINIIAQLKTKAEKKAAEA